MYPDSSKDLLHADCMRI